MFAGLHQRMDGFSCFQPLARRGLWRYLEKDDEGRDRGPKETTTGAVDRRRCDCGEMCQMIAAAAFTLFNYCIVIFRQMRMISLLSGLAVLPMCYLLHDSHIFGLTLRRFRSCLLLTPGWARETLALAQEAVRVSRSPRFLCSC